MDLKEDIRAHGKIAQLVKKPRKPYKCVECGIPTAVGEPHYMVTHGGSGLGSIKFPDRVCAGCIRVHMGLNPTAPERCE